MINKNEYLLQSGTLDSWKYLKIFIEDRTKNEYNYRNDRLVQIEPDEHRIGQIRGFYDKLDSTIWFAKPNVQLTDLKKSQVPIWQFYSVIGLNLQLSIIHTDSV